MQWVGGWQVVAGALLGSGKTRSQCEEAAGLSVEEEGVLAGQEVVWTGVEVLGGRRAAAMLLD